VTIIDAVSLHPEALVHMNLYVPVFVNVVMFVEALVALTIVAVPGLPVIVAHVPIPVPAIVAMPPGSTTQLTVWFGPALGLAVTTIEAVSLQPDALVQIYL
jgi:hypothetical protein